MFSIGSFEYMGRVVRAIHLFLSDSEIQKIKEYVPQALGEVEHLIAAENNFGRIVGFMGTLAIGWKCSFCLPIKEDRGQVNSL